MEAAIPPPPKGGGILAEIRMNLFNYQEHKTQSIQNIPIIIPPIIGIPVRRNSIPKRPLISSFNSLSWLGLCLLFIPRNTITDVIAIIRLPMNSAILPSPFFPLLYTDIVIIRLKNKFIFSIRRFLKEKNHA
jgi:hypothetical protein